MGEVNKKGSVPEQIASIRRNNFDEVCLGYSFAEAQEEASRCLGCKNSEMCCCSLPCFCKDSSIINHIKNGDLLESAKVIDLDTSLPAYLRKSLSQESQCEGACIRGIKGQPVAIGC
jgi:glutamate synthase (NADPH/NADH) small chain